MAPADFSCAANLQIPVRGAMTGASLFPGRTALRLEQS
jgi:hypothetical protein